VVGELLAAPPARGQLRAELKRLAARTWKHPVSGEPTQFAYGHHRTLVPGGAQRRSEPGGGVAGIGRQVRII